ncbi:MAG: hypothetical protein AAFX99_12850, partial [Myxococcota bacterium]
MTDIAQPLTLPASGVVLKNRIAKAAMSERMAAPDHAPSAELLTLYTRWARGGSGLLLTGNIMVDSNALGEQGNVAVEDERHMEGLRAWAQASTAHGTHAWVQINHPGRQSPRFVSRQPVAPSPVPLKGFAGLFATPRALEDHEIRNIIDRFAATAALTQEAGFSGVQIHGAHGYLISQFLSPRT